MSYLEGYQGQFGFLDPLTLLIVGTTAAGIYQLIKPGEQEPGTKYVKSGYPIKSRTLMPPNGRMTWVTPEDMGSIVITIVDGADTVLKKIQVFAVNQLKQSLPGAPENAQFWDMYFIGWKGSGKNKKFKADPSRGDYYYYIDGAVKEVPVVEQNTKTLSNQTQQATDLVRQALEQGNLELAQKYMEMALQLEKQTRDTSKEAGSDAAAEAAELAKAAVAQMQAMFKELQQMKATQGKMPSWAWIAIAAGALFLLTRHQG